VAKSEGKGGEFVLGKKNQLTCKLTINLPQSGVNTQEDCLAVELTEGLGCLLLFL